MGWSRELVIFDNDGVLVDSERFGNRVLADLLTELGYPITFDESVRRFMGGTLAGTRAAVEADLGRPLPDDFEDRYLQTLFALFRSSLQPVAGVEAVVEALQRAGTPICVASSARHEKINLALSTVGLLDRFDGRIFSAQDVARGKPAPDLFLHAAATCGASPDGCVVVEDSPAGVRGAKAAGMTVVGFISLMPPARLIEAGADVVIESMDQLLDALTELSPSIPEDESPAGYRTA